MILYGRAPESKWIHQWYPPKNAAAFFAMDSDEDFKRRHPVGYGFLVVLGMIALLLPLSLFVVYVAVVHPNANGWIVPGMVGTFVIGIGLFNFVAIIIRQYLGHWVSILSFLIGGLLTALSLYML